MLHEDKIVCCFIGHRMIPESEPVMEQVENWIQLLLAMEKPLRFLNGGMGYFDKICCDTVAKYKKLYPQREIEHWLVIPYMTSNLQADKKNLQGIYDKIIQPTFPEGMPRQTALPARNHWMVDQSDYALAYVTHPSGGAYQTFSYALQRPHISVVQIGSLTLP